MKLLTIVSAIEPKRCFILSQRFTSKKIRKKGIKTHKPSEKILINNLSKVQKEILKLNEQSLDQIISSEYKKRILAYNSLKWHIGEVRTSEVKVWRKTGGLYQSWTDRSSLKRTADKLRIELHKEHSQIHRRRAMYVVPEIIKIKQLIKKEKYLLPIVIPNGTYKKYSGGIRSIPWFIDDGCMRSLAYAISGDEIIKVYIGIPYIK